MNPSGGADIDGGLDMRPITEHYYVEQDDAISIDLFFNQDEKDMPNRSRPLVKSQRSLKSLMSRIETDTTEDEELMLEGSSESYARRGSFKKMLVRSGSTKSFEDKAIRDADAIRCADTNPQDSKSTEFTPQRSLKNILARSISSKSLKIDSANEIDQVEDKNNASGKRSVKRSASSPRLGKRLLRTPSAKSIAYPTDASTDDWKRKEKRNENSSAYMKSSLSMRNILSRAVGESRAKPSQLKDAAKPNQAISMVPQNSIRNLVSRAGTTKRTQSDETLESTAALVDQTKRSTTKPVVLAPQRNLMHLLSLSRSFKGKLGVLETGDASGEEDTVGLRDEELKEKCSSIAHDNANDPFGHESGPRAGLLLDDPPSDKKLKQPSKNGQQITGKKTEARMNQRRRGRRLRASASAKGMGSYRRSASGKRLSSNDAEVEDSEKGDTESEELVHSESLRNIFSENESSSDLNSSLSDLSRSDTKPGSRSKVDKNSDNRRRSQSSRRLKKEEAPPKHQRRHSSRNLSTDTQKSEESSRKNQRRHSSRNISADTRRNEETSQKHHRRHSSRNLSTKTSRHEDSSSYQQRRHSSRNLSTDTAPKSDRQKRSQSMLKKSGSDVGRSRESSSSRGDKSTRPSMASARRSSKLLSSDDSEALLESAKAASTEIPIGSNPERRSLRASVSRRNIDGPLLAPVYRSSDRDLSKEKRKKAEGSSRRSIERLHQSDRNLARDPRNISRRSGLKTMDKQFSSLQLTKQ